MLYKTHTKGNDVTKLTGSNQLYTQPALGIAINEGDMACKLLEIPIDHRE